MTIQRSWLLVGAAVGLLGTAAAQAGYVYHPVVEFYDGWYDEMSGSMVGAHDSANSTEYLRCRPIASGPATAYCYGRTASGTYKSCSTNNPDMVQAAQSIDAYSYVRFGFFSGECFFIEVQHGSQYLP